MLDSSTFSQFEKFKNEKNYLYNSITPCDFLLKNFNEIIKRQENFDVIFNTCPISSDYLNKKIIIKNLQMYSQQLSQMIFLISMKI